MASTRKGHSTDVNDAEWLLLEPPMLESLLRRVLSERAARARRMVLPLREVVDAVR